MQQSPLPGVPVGIKDAIDTRDQPTGFNSPHFEGHFPNIDAASVAVLRAAGAVILRNEGGHRRADLLAALDLAARCRAAFDALAAPFDAVLTPSTPGVAPLGPEDTGAATFNRIWTLLHTPCVNVPGLSGPGGLPVGLTLTGPRFRDRQLLAVAARVGDALGPPPDGEAA